jgi:hypothetical protein
MVHTPIGSFHLRICSFVVSHLRVLMAPCSCANWASSIWGRLFGVVSLGSSVWARKVGARCEQRIGRDEPCSSRGTVKSSSRPRLAPVAEPLARAGGSVSPKYWLFLGAESLVSQEPLAYSPPFPILIGQVYDICAVGVLHSSRNSIQHMEYLFDWVSPLSRLSGRLGTSVSSVTELTHAACNFLR